MHPLLQRKNYIFILVILFTICDGNVIFVRNLDFTSNGSPLGLKLPVDKEDKNEDVLNVDTLDNENLKIVNTVTSNDNNNNTDKKINSTGTGLRTIYQNGDDIKISGFINDLRLELNENLSSDKNEHSIQRLSKIKHLLENIKKILKKKKEKALYNYEFK